MILGAGVVGKNAAITAQRLGAEIIVLDNDVEKLRQLYDLSERKIVTGFANSYNIRKAVAFADVLIGAVLIHGGERTPHIVTREMVKTMKKRSVIIDVSIDQGGCVETSRPTDLTGPIFVEEDVIHYCVPNIPSKVARTASHALANALLPYITQITENNLETALKKNKGFAKGVYTYRGKCVNMATADVFGLEFNDIDSVL